MPFNSDEDADGQGLHVRCKTKNVCELVSKKIKVNKADKGNVDICLK